MVRTTDGFELADEDLRLRGEGTLFDTKQSGMPDLKLARLADDLDLVKRARDAGVRADRGRSAPGAPPRAARRAPGPVRALDRLALPLLSAVRARVGSSRMRIVAGSAKGMRLAPGARRGPSALRPGPRGPVLAASAPEVAGARVLDLFAGTGRARGSRRSREGPSEAVFVDRSYEAAAARPTTTWSAPGLPDRADGGHAATPARSCGRRPRPGGRSTWCSSTRRTRSGAPELDDVLRRAGRGLARGRRAGRCAHQGQQEFHACHSATLGRSRGSSATATAS